MNALEHRVWLAIESALNREGDSDIKAGLAWITEEQAERIARAAIEAVKDEQSVLPAIPDELG